MHHNLMRVPELDVEMERVAELQAKLEAAINELYRPEFEEDVTDKKNSHRPGARGSMGERCVGRAYR